MTEPMSATTFAWFLTALTGGLASTWFVHDAVALIRSRKHDRGDPVVRDKHFGYVIGMVIGVLGVVGSLKFQGVL